MIKFKKQVNSFSTKGKTPVIHRNTIGENCNTFNMFKNKYIQP